jgi:DNA-3-methyladenine glycosylase I
MKRCGWAEGDPLLRAYHDAEWGVPERDGRALWEKLVLDGFQAGLSWLIILRKRDAFRKAFRGFDPEVVAKLGKRDIDRLMQDAGIVRARAKIEATIGNARAYLAMQKAGEDFATYAWTAAGGKPLLRGAVEDAEEARLQVRRPGDRLRVDAGDRARERSHGRMLSPRAGTEALSSALND